MSSKRNHKSKSKKDKSKKRQSKKDSKSKSRKHKREKPRQIPINYESPPIPHAKGHAEFDSQMVESVEICSDVQQSDDAKYDFRKQEVGGRFFDEVEMKSHGMVDKQGHHVHPNAAAAETEETGVTTPTHHIPFDEIAMKQSGFVDDHCHHMTENELQSPPPEEDSRPHINVASTVDAVTLKAPSSVVGTSEAASNEELLVTLRESIEKSENILDELKYRHEYIEYRTGDKGRAMAVWPDGTEDTYEFTGETIYQIPRQPAK